MPGRRISEFNSALLRQLEQPTLGHVVDRRTAREDVFTDRVTVEGKKQRAAFALKRPAKTGPLVPGKMGKNGDQIRRLFDSPATFFIVQYEGEVKESVYKLMEELAKTKAILGGEIFWTVIDDDATKRLRKACPRAFGK